MEDLLSKEHYCYKIHVLLMERSASPFYRQPKSPLNKGFTPPHYKKGVGGGGGSQYDNPAMLEK